MAAIGSCFGKAQRNMAPSWPRISQCDILWYYLKELSFWIGETCTAFNITLFVCMWSCEKTTRFDGLSRQKRHLKKKTWWQSTSPWKQDMYSSKTVMIIVTICDDLASKRTLKNNTKNRTWGVCSSRGFLLCFWTSSPHSCISAWILLNEYLLSCLAVVMIHIFI
jgi:hypothetical protein